MVISVIAGRVTRRSQSRQATPLIGSWLPVSSTVSTLPRARHAEKSIGCMSRMFALLASLVDVDAGLVTRCQQISRRLRVAGVVRVRAGQLLDVGGPEVTAVVGLFRR